MTRDPDLLVLNDATYKSELEDWWDDDWGKPWYWRILDVKPRAFYDADEDRIVVRASAKDNDKLLAHELGHALGFGHPESKFSVAYWFDVMGPTWPRFIKVLDRHGVMEQYRRWRADQDP